MFRKVEQELGRKIPDALKKLSGGKWKWKPEEGEWFECGGELVLLPQRNELVDWRCEDGTLSIRYYHSSLYPKKYFVEHNYPLIKCIPLLHWENHLEKILEGMGYIVSIRRNLEPELAKGHFCCEIEKGFDFPSYFECGETRQEAVQKAIIALAEGKEK